MSAATERLPLRARLGGRWFGSWAVWGISMPFGLLVLASDLVASTSVTELAQWILVWVFAGLVTAAILAALQATVLRKRADAPISVLEVPTEPAVSGACRFLLGSVDVLHYVWEAMERGIPYERAAASA